VFIIEILKEKIKEYLLSETYSIIKERVLDLELDFALRVYV
jgi:hypothetical protein